MVKEWYARSARPVPVGDSDSQCAVRRAGAVDMYSATYLPPLSSLTGTRRRYRSMRHGTTSPAAPGPSRRARAWLPSLHLTAGPVHFKCRFQCHPLFRSASGPPPVRARFLLHNPPGRGARAGPPRFCTHCVRVGLRLFPAGLLLRFLAWAPGRLAGQCH